MNFKKLHLEKIKIPGNISQYMEDDVWECFDYEPFVINITSILHKGKEGLSYSLEFSPFDDEFEDLNNKLEQYKYVADGYGWTDYVLTKLKEEGIVFEDEVSCDSETDTCVLVAYNEKDFKILLQKFSDYIKGLLENKKEKEEVDTRTVIITRSWDDHDEIDNVFKPEIMCQRPRIDYRVSEYIWSFIEENLLIPKKILQKNSIRITLFIGRIRKNAKYFYGSIYDTETKKFRPSVRGNKLKEVDIFCYYNGFTEKMTPTEYADIIYDTYCSFLTDNFKKITKEECDNLKSSIDFDFINSFEFPATFENQKYSLDGGSIGINPVYNKEQGKWVSEKEYCLKDVYLKCFGK